MEKESTIIHQYQDSWLKAWIESQRRKNTTTSQTLDQCWKKTTALANIQQNLAAPPKKKEGGERQEIEIALTTSFI